MGGYQEIDMPHFCSKMRSWSRNGVSFLNQIQIFQRLADPAVFQGAGHIISL